MYNIYKYILVYIYFYVVCVVTTQDIWKESRMLFCIVIVLPSFVIFVVVYTLCCVSWGDEGEEAELEDEEAETSDDEMNSAAEPSGELQADAG